ncbi:MAG: 50S ribosomal protein L5 [candidate division TM6 bacterium GW2011_GWF2_38_10]|nr:MAG: 50S ribosomal protein L5 [candidate division TM6 bacterium GW2011_GWF2_38_10]
MIKSRLEEQYKTQLRSDIFQELKLQNMMQVPALSKIVVNIGVKEAVSDGKVLNQVKDIIEQITGQVAVKTLAKKSIAAFKLRQGMPIGVKVTLRKNHMYHFLDKLINVVLPSVRDFQGVTASFDGDGNYNLGIKDWLVFPEIDYDNVDKSRGINITFHTTTKHDEHAHVLLKKFNMPFCKK